MNLADTQGSSVLSSLYLDPNIMVYFHWPDTEWLTLYISTVFISSNLTVDIMKQYIPEVRMGILYSLCSTHICIHENTLNVTKIIMHSYNWWVFWVFNIILWNQSTHSFFFFVLGHSPICIPESVYIAQLAR